MEEAGVIRGGPVRQDRIGIAWPPILVVAGALVALLLAYASEYGFHRDTVVAVYPQMTSRWSDVWSGFLHLD